MNINLAIDRLVLEGFALEAGATRQVQVAVEAELLRLLIDGGLPSGLLAGAATPVLRAPAITSPPDLPPAGLGAQIAQAVYGSLQG